jgi:hypothetical protein
MSVLVVGLLTGGVVACGGAEPVPPAPSPTGTATRADDPADARVQLAARAALAQDHRFAALYRYTGAGQPNRDIVATVAGDGTWRVDVAGGALGGTTDVAIVSLTSGVYQCALPSAANPVTPGCVRVAAPGRRVPAENDPRIERVFRQWLKVFTDRQSPLSVSTARPLPGSRGTCFSVDSISASLKPPVDIGIYCYGEDGLLTAARVEAGTVTLAGTPVKPPATVRLPGPVSDGPPMGLDAPEPVDSSAPPA